MGNVFLSRDVALDRPVAIKLLPPALATVPELRERFLREARTAAARQGRAPTQPGRAHCPRGGVGLAHAHLLEYAFKKGQEQLTATVRLILCFVFLAFAVSNHLVLVRVQHFLSVPPPSSRPMRRASPRISA